MANACTTADNHEGDAVTEGSLKQRQHSSTSSLNNDKEEQNICKVLLHSPETPRQGISVKPNENASFLGYAGTVLLLVVRKAHAMSCSMATPLCQCE